MKKNKNGFALIAGISLVLLITIIAIYILEYIIPFSKNVKGIENSSLAYYQSNSAVEKSLYFINNNPEGSEDSKDFGSTASEYKYSITATGNILPPPGEGNSDFNKDYNKIYAGNPIELDVSDNRITNWNNTDFYFRVPDLSGDGSPDINGSSDDLIINWQLNTPNGSLNASGSLITASDINSESKINLGTKDGLDLDGTEEKLGDYYDDNCDTGKCTLKLSIINKLETISGVKIPYLEWKIDNSAGNSNLFLDNIKINTSGKSYLYKRNIDIIFPTKKTIEAFDFTVFQ